MHLGNVYICRKLIQWVDLEIETGRTKNINYVKKSYRLSTPKKNSILDCVYIFYTSTFGLQQFCFV